jgi:hypothetical protein
MPKLVLLLSVRYAITCLAITVTSCHFTWCSVVINVMFNTVKPLSIVSDERTSKINDERGKVVYFELFGGKCSST